MNEIWKDITEYENDYQASNCGRIKSLDKLRNGKNGSKVLYEGRILKGAIGGRGYLLVCLSKKKTSRTKAVHRLVAEAFIPNPENKSQINHKNGIKTDNRVENLEWCTPSENLKHAFKLELFSTKGEKNGMSVLTEENVRKIKKDLKNGMVQSKIAKKYNISQSQISAINTGKNWSHV